MNKEYNKIFLNIPLFFRNYGENSIVADGSSLQFIIEECIALSATNIALRANSVIAEFTNNIPEAFKKRIIIIDKKRKIAQQNHAIFEPLIEEFGLDIKGYGNAMTIKNKKVDYKLATQVFSLYRETYDFLVGMEYKLQIDININRIKKTLNTLLRISRNPESRAILSILLGIFKTYRPEMIASIKLKSQSPEYLVKLFKEFVQDETYRQLSHQVYFIGFPQYINRSFILVSRLGEKLITKSPFKQIITLSSRGVSAVKHIPLPDSEMYASLIKENYFPPIISLDKCITKAKKNWELIKPEVIPPQCILKDKYFFEYNKQNK
ncbi:MAG: hypothetical protein WC614_04700 [bacterium]